MKKWQQRFMAIATALGFKDKVKDGTLSREDQKAIFAEYQKQHNISFADDKAANEDVVVEQDDVLLSAEEITSLATLLEVEPGNVAAKPKEAVQQLSGKVQQQQQQINKLKSEPEDENPEKVFVSGQMKPAIVLGHVGHSPAFLFGIESEIFARKNWWNEITATVTSKSGNISAQDKTAFMDAFHERAKSISGRAIELQKSNQVSSLDYNKMIAGEAHIDYSSLTDIAGEFVVRRNDLILAYFRTLPSVAGIFPVVSNVQNKEEAPTATFGELSQGYREGRIFKGSVGFSAEVYSVVDVMFKYQFSDLIALEKKYIGYLNREGSDVIKWTFIEWIMVYFGRQLLNEQNRRRVIGVRVPQQAVVGNSAMLAADGALRAIERVEEELKVLPFGS